MSGLGEPVSSAGPMGKLMKEASMVALSIPEVLHSGHDNLVFGGDISGKLAGFDARLLIESLHKGGTCPQWLASCSSHSGAWMPRHWETLKTGVYFRKRRTTISSVPSESLLFAFPMIRVDHKGG